MIFDLVNDFSQTLADMPAQHPRRRHLQLIDEAIRRDVHHIDRFPTSLFQSLWNSCWWYDSPQATEHYDGTSESNGVHSNGLPKSLRQTLQSWRTVKENKALIVVWPRALRPPAVNLGAGIQSVLKGHHKEVRCVTWSNDGFRIVSASDDRTIRIWVVQDVSTLDKPSHKTMTVLPQQQSGLSAPF